MSHTEQEVVVLFTDIAGYTDYVSRCGNLAAMELLNRHNALLRPVIEQYGGAFVKSTGDGLIAYFQHTKQAVDAAVVIQQRLAAFNLQRREDEEIHIRAALHHGVAVVEESEIIGSAVNVAARLVAVCKRDQILVSAELYKRVRRATHLAFKKIGRLQLKGVPAFQDAYEVSWQLETLKEQKKFSFVKARWRWPARPVVLASLVAIVGVIGSVLGYLLIGGLSGSGPALHTDSPEAKELYGLAKHYQLKGDDEQAVTALQQSVAIDPSFPEAHLELSYLFYDMDELEAANEHARIAEGLSASLAEHVHLKAKALLTLIDGDSMRAVQLFQLVTDQYPTDTDALYYLAESATDAGRLGQARHALEKCVQVDTVNPYCNYQLMMAQVRNNEFDAVLASYASLQKRDVTYIWLEEPAALALWGKGSLDSAAQKFTALAAAKPGEIRAHGTIHFKTAKAWLADLAAYRGDIKGAVEQLERMLTEELSEDTRIDGLVYLAQVQQIMGNHGETVTRLREQMAKHPDLKVTLRAARILAHLGETTELTNLLQKTRASNEATSGVSPGLGHLLRGAVAAAQGRLQDAEAELSLSYQLENDLNTLALLIHINMAQEDWHSAAKLAGELSEYKGRILADYPPSLWGLAHYEFAVCQDQVDNRKTAVEYYKRFLKVWSAANPELPPVKKAKERLRALEPK